MTRPDGFWSTPGIEVHRFTEEDMAAFATPRFPLDIEISTADPPIKEFVIDPADARAGLAADLDES